MTKNVLVTGATGMIGANLCRRMIAENYSISILSRPGSDRKRLSALADRISVFEAAITDAAAVGRVIASTDPDIIIHLATTPFNPPTTPVSLHVEINILGMASILQSLITRPRTRFIYTGSAAEYGSGPNLSENSKMAPATVYGATKGCASLLMDTFVRAHNIDAVRLVLFTPYGPWERPSRLIPSIILNALAGEPVRIGDGRQQRDFVYIDDVIEAIIRAAENGVSPGTVLNISSGVGVPIKDVATTILDLMGNPVPLLAGTRQSRSDEIWEISGNSEMAHRAMAWTPAVDFTSGLRRTIEWYTSNQELACALS